MEEALDLSFDRLLMMMMMMIVLYSPTPVVVRCKAWVGRSIFRFVGFESRLGHGYLSLASVVCCQVQVSVTERSLLQSNPTECGLSECDRAASRMRRPWPTRGCYAMKKKSCVHL